VILDMEGLPDMSGFELIQKLEAFKSQNMPLLLFILERTL
jgi:DNA-binding response OmpR family regulator